MRFACIGIGVLGCALTFAQTIDVGSGSPNSAVQAAFVNAFYRNGFSNLVSLPPLGNVKAFGTPGLVQEFTDGSKNKYALLMPNPAVPFVADNNGVFQLMPLLYAYYSSVGSNTAGYPIGDSLNCPPLSSASSTCQYDVFTKNYALFAYSAALPSGVTNIATRDPFFTRWNSFGGIAGIGPAVTAETTVTSSVVTIGTTAAAATLQTFDTGAIFNITSGPLSGRLVAVAPIVYSLYSANRGYLGFLGFPTADEVVLSTGRHRQTFEGGAIEYDPGGSPVLRMPVQTVVISSGFTKLNLNLGDTATLQATPYDANGVPLTDRTIAWSTSNSRVVSLQPSGATVTLKAVAGGAATITATSEGKSSGPISVFVSASCCGIGEGAPTPAIQQQFQDAVARNKLTLHLPIPTPVSRVGNGYLQNAQDAAGGNPYWLTVPDGAGTGYVVGGLLLSKFTELGGVTGALGYPRSDATVGGRQMFQNQTALAGNPVRLVSGAFLTKWAALKYETGVAGSPASEPALVLTFRATIGMLQMFANGLMASAQTGPKTGAVYFVSGPVLAAYNQAGAASGSLGLPVSDEFLASPKQRQDFEGGFVDYAPGDSIGQVHPADRTPLVTATPANVLAGGRVRLAAGGFNPGSTLRVSISGLPDFLVKTDNGAYSWEATVPLSAKTGVVSIHAADTAGASADGSYSVRAQSDVRLQVAKISGDGQNGLPGALLPQPLKILLLDDLGDPVTGAQVHFSASPGAQVIPTSAVTGPDGQAQSSLRLPASDGIALATAEAGGQIVTFGAQAAHGSLPNFPSMSQASSVTLGNGPDTIAAKGALLASAAAILRYYQNRGDLPAPNGFSDPQALNQFLKGFCVYDIKGAQICDGFLSPRDSTEQIVNLWRLASFAGNALDVAALPPDIIRVRDILSGGVPVLLALSIATNGLAAGGHFVVATGIAADGSVVIMDPNPAFGKSNLNDYLAGYAGVTGTLAGAVQIAPRIPVSRGFLVAGTPAFEISSPTGTCGVNLDLPSVTAAQPQPVGVVVSQFRMRFCDGAGNLYQLDSTTSAPFALTLTDLGDPGNRVDLSGAGLVSFKLSRLGAQWTAAAQELSFLGSSVLNAATFTPDLAPGALISVFGSGMAGPGSKTAIEVSGLPAPVIAQTPFQVNAQIPFEAGVGATTVKITSAFGAAEQPIQIGDVAPGIFRISSQSAAILNLNNTLNAPDNPAKRGETVVIFCTGLGLVTSQGSLKVAQAPVTALVQGAVWKPDFAGLTPGFIGLYQVNLPVPAAAPPGLGLSLSLQQGGLTSNTVPISIQ